MIITGTSDKIRFVLGASATTTQLPFTANYNNYTATGVTLNSNNGTSNNTTAVDIVGSPASGEQNELRYCSIYNSDTVSAIVKIQLFDGTNTRVVFQCTLSVGDTLQYQLEKGWEVIDAGGDKKTIAVHSFFNGMKANTYFRPIGVASSVAITTQVWHGISLGKAEKAYTSFNIVYNVTVAAITVTYAELAVYAGNYKAVEGGFSVPVRRVGVTDISSIVTSLGVKNTTISTTGIQPGDFMFVTFANQASTVMSLRSLGYADANNHYTQATIANTIAGGRPSLVPTGPYYSGIPTQQIWMAWQAS